MIELIDKFPFIDFKLKSANVRINFSKHLTKKEKIFFKYLKEQKYNHISLEKLISMLKLESQEEAIKFLILLKNKTIILSSIDKNYYIYLNIIQSFYINNGIIYISFSDEIASSFKKGSYFERLGLNNILILEEKFSYRLYQYICSSNEKKIYISMEDLRELLEINHSYQRFYDIEKNFLIPIFEDIHKNCNKKFSYRKKKDGEYKGARILGINIIKDDYFENKKISNIQPPINQFMKKLKKHINNFSEIYSLLDISIANYGQEYVGSKISYILDNFNSNIEEHLKTIFATDIIDKPSFIITKKFKNIFELHSTILTFIQKHNLTQISTYMFPIKLYSLKGNETLILQDKNYKIKITYRKNDISKVEFFINN